MRLEKSYEPAAVEAKWYAEWEGRGYFRPEAVSDATGDPFVIVIPPPNITGSLHMGHALNTTLQDILVRYHRMNRRPTLWLPGTDHAGIATQVVVERRLPGGAAERRGMGREAFVAKVWEWRKVSGNTILQQLRRLGVSCDWSRERFTLDEGLTRAVREVFVALHEQGLIYRGDRLINWCVGCGTALSDLEVEYKDQKGALYYIKYGDLEVATTRPETKVGDTALAVHPDDRRYQHLIGTTLTIPTELGPVQLPVIGDEVVDPTFGSGIVKVTPAHDPADFDMGQRHQLPVKRVIGEDGKMTAEAGKYAGMDRFACRTQIVEDLKALDLLIKEEPHQNRVGGCQRCGTVVEPLISRQWFVKIEPLATPALQAVRDGRTRFVPKHWENTYFAWMENIRDWCISRQLWWGHRIPAWTCSACHHLIVAREDPARCPKCDGSTLEQESDVLDTWFSSGLWPFSTHGWPDKTEDVRRYYPSTVLVTGFDIIFFWVARMMMLGLRFMGDVPFKDIVIHGLVRDATGQKMSKSKGNVVDPLGLLDEFGTDATRFALTACVGMGRDLRLDQQRIIGYRNFANKLWNAARFLLMNLEGAGPLAAQTATALGQGNRPADLTLPDRWLLSRLERTVTAVRAAIESYNFSDAADQLYRFAWHELCDWYVEAAKGPLFGGGDAADRTRGVLAHALERLMRLLHPVMPFISEEIWQAITAETWGTARAERFQPSVMIEHFPVPMPALIDDAAEQEMERVIALVRAVRNIRSEFNVPPSRTVAVEIAVVPEARASIEAAAPLVRTLARIDPLDFKTAAELPKAAAVETVDGVEIAVPLAQMVEDVGAEIARLERELGKAASEHKTFAAKLANPQFADKAPEDVVAEVRDKAAAVEEKQRTLQRSLDRLRTLGGAK